MDESFLSLCAESLMEAPCEDSRTRVKRGPGDRGRSTTGDGFTAGDQETGVTVAVKRDSETQLKQLIGRSNPDKFISVALRARLFQNMPFHLSSKMHQTKGEVYCHLMIKFKDFSNLNR